MSDQTSQEPTMEEILASIRRIISEDDVPAEGAAPAEAEPEPEAALAAAAFEPAPEEEDDGVLELTERVETLGDLDVYTPTVSEEPEEPPPVAAAAAEYEPEPAPVAPGEGLVGPIAASAAASAFGQLSAAIQMPADGRTLEDVVRELLRPLLKDWLDSNLPQIVQATVDREVERIARGQVR
jgi:cell pole-organizing protein PopZ